MSGSDWSGTAWENNGGMLNDHFQLTSGQVSQKRIDGQEAIILHPGTTLELHAPVINPNQPHTASVWVYKQNKWTSENADRFLNKGCIKIESDKESLILTNLRYYNWELEEIEKQYDATTELVCVEAANRNKKGLVISLDANQFAAGDTIGYIPNNGIEGVFEAQNAPVIVEKVQGKKHFGLIANNTSAQTSLCPPRFMIMLLIHWKHGY